MDVKGTSYVTYFFCEILLQNISIYDKISKKITDANMYVMHVIMYVCQVPNKHFR